MRHTAVDKQFGAGRTRTNLSFSPLQVTSCDIWIPATADVSSRVGPSWASVRPPEYQAAGISGKPGLDFDASNTEYLNEDLSGLGSGTTHHFFWALDIDVVGANTQLFRAGALVLIVYLSNGSSQLGIYDGAHRSSGQAASTGAQVIELQLVPGAGGGRFYVDGSAVGSAFDYTAAVINNAQVGLLSSSDGASGNVDATLAHFVHCTSILTGSELTEMRAFLTASVS